MGVRLKRSWKFEIAEKHVDILVGTGLTAAPSSACGLLRRIKFSVKHG
jgi:hypothetical protein